EEEGPIFVVGFPRSGTTMVEQILASHPNIVAGDEMHAVAQLAGETPQRLKSKSPYPECLDTLTGTQGERLVQGLRDSFTRMVQLHGVMEPGKGRYTDKTPLNETHLGLLHLLFPEAPLVHLIRHPLDVVLSSFFNDVRHGGHFASRLEDTARHYAMTMDMVQQYRDELDLNYLPLRYEDLVDEQETNTRKLLEFVGEPWHEGCLEFHRNKREARTASYAQVKEKLYTRSRFRYKNYRAHLDSIIPILEPHIERLGYSVDGD
ncbi:MAG: sulfotransferase, partial [Gammaproteobacteria bacterium]|nr:sulfotransferase [Gammaproteobacteria bacterium]MCW8958742.1 sulfotransferase [Gammaproteobacteria bacterium]